MEYANQAQEALANPRARFQDARAGSLPTAAIEKPALDALVDRMAKEVAAIEENVARLTQFKNRLLNPHPEKVGESGPNAPSANSIEGRLGSLISITHEIGARLNQVVNELDRSA